MTTITKPSAAIQTFPNSTRQIVLNKTAREAKLYRMLTPKDLVPRLGTSEDMVRIFLRKNYPAVHVNTGRNNNNNDLAHANYIYNGAISKKLVSDSRIS